MMQSTFAIETQHLNYAFTKHRKVINELSLQVPAGSIFGFLGPNGAGKTTTMRMLTGIIPSEKDNIFLMGKSLQQSMPQIFTDIGTLIETPSLYLHLSGYDNLKILCTLRGMDADKINPVLKTVGLLQDGKRKVKEYSLGMKQRLGIAMALMPNPKLLLLDEPVNGLDPVGIVEIRELLKQLNQEHNITVFISSHLLNEVEKTCTHVSIIHKGDLHFQGTLKEMYQTQQAEKEALFTVNNAQAAAALMQAKSTPVQILNDNHIQLAFENEYEIAGINKYLIENGISVSGIDKKMGLEDWFIKITSK